MFEIIETELYIVSECKHQIPTNNSRKNAEDNTSSNVLRTSVKTTCSILGNWPITAAELGQVCTCPLTRMNFAHSASSALKYPQIPAPDKLL